MQSKQRRLFMAGGATAAMGLWLGLRGNQAAGAAGAPQPADIYPVMHTDAQWRSLLTPSQYYILRQEGTERPYSSPLNDEHRSGIFSCAGCRQRLFSSRTKFESHTGWPSFWTPLEQAVRTRRDSTLGFTRTEVHCARCGGHLGHVFEDGPPPTGLRYCMDGAAMNFTPGTA
jgi:peptide-methionine (R)-S-oxide reductase